MERKRSSVPTKKMILTKIKNVEPELRELKVTAIYLFGSFARGEAERNSDIDVLVECRDGVTLFDLAGVKLLLEKTLHRKVDVVMREALRKEFRNDVEREMIRAA